MEGNGSPISKMVSGDKHCKIAEKRRMALKIERRETLAADKWTLY